MKEQRGGVSKSVCVKTERKKEEKEREGKRGRRENWECAATRGVKKVAIVFYVPLENPGSDQANFFLSLSSPPRPPPL